MIDTWRMESSASNTVTFKIAGDRKSGFVCSAKMDGRVFGFYGPPDQRGNLGVLVIASLMSNVLGECGQCIVIERTSLGLCSPMNGSGLRHADFPGRDLWRALVRLRR